jgi:hypothetical protein
LVFPDFWTGIVRCASLGIKQTLFGNFGNVQIAKLRGLVLVKENISALHVSVENLHVVECLKAFDNLDDDLPNVLFLHKLLGLLALADSLEAVSVVCELHHDTAKLE